MRASVSQAKSYFNDNEISYLIPDLTVSMQARPMPAQPVARAHAVGIEAVHQAPEARPVIHLDQMGDLMGDHVIEHPFRGQDEAPGEG